MGWGSASYWLLQLLDWVDKMMIHQTQRQRHTHRERQTEREREREYSIKEERQGLIEWG